MPSCPELKTLRIDTNVLMLSLRSVRCPEPSSCLLQFLQIPECLHKCNRASEETRKVQKLIKQYGNPRLDKLQDVSRAPGRDGPNPAARILQFLQLRKRFYKGD
jgi:hypothetical protein